jgi:hypothetical protein
MCGDGGAGVIDDNVVANGLWQRKGNFLEKTLRKN